MRESFHWERASHFSAISTPLLMDTVKLSSCAPTLSTSDLLVPPLDFALLLAPVEGGEGAAAFPPAKTPKRFEGPILPLLLPPTTPPVNKSSPLSRPRPSFPLFWR